MRRLTILVCALSFSVIGFSQSNYFSLSDWDKILSLSSPALSPNGKQALFLSSRKNFEQNRVLTELIHVETASRSSRVLVKEKSGLGVAKWSPSGEWISFLASGKQGRQLFILPASAGESQQLTNVDGSIKSYEWNRASNKIVFILSSTVRKKADSFNDSFEIGNHDFLKQQPSSSNTLWLCDVMSKEVKQILPDSVSVSTELVTSSLSWSPDGKKVIVTVFPTSNSGDSDSGKLYSIDIERPSLEPVTNNTMFEGDGRFSDDGKQIGFLFPRDGVAANQTELHLLQDKKLINISKEVDRDS